MRTGRGRSSQRTINELNPLLRGWVQYFRLTQAKGVLTERWQWPRSMVEPWRVPHEPGAFGSLLDAHQVAHCRPSYSACSVSVEPPYANRTYGGVRGSAGVARALSIRFQLRIVGHGGGTAAVMT